MIFSLYIGIATVHDVDNFSKQTDVICVNLAIVFLTFKNFNTKINLLC